MASLNVVFRVCVDATFYANFLHVRSAFLMSRNDNNLAVYATLQLCWDIKYILLLRKQFINKGYMSTKTFKYVLLLRKVFVYKGNMFTRH